MIAIPCLRQVALVVSDGAATAATLRATFGWPDPFHDPGVGEFGLTNSVFAVGDTFLEVVSPMRPGTTAGRYLERRGADSGYMAIFQVADVVAARARVADAGMRVVWMIDLDDIAGTHLHPKDTPGAIVSLDSASPPGAWRWAGPDWTGAVPDHGPGGISGITVEVGDPAAAARQWGRALGLDASTDGAASVLSLDDARQTLRFVATSQGRGDGITEVWLRGDWPEAELAGVRFRSGRP
ncbi:MAG TPA: hypothetical protein VHA73_12460 [Acidimicrobiales bacterium]|jgi:hypothetical protein|nr:hypothetical protein [Acidimicrobiales bacterium]